MPTYSYACQECHYEFDLRQSIKAKPKRRCPKCDRLSLKRLIGVGSGIIFRGSGFYTTDYRDENRNNTRKS
jgi:putative FmdB family regulatory protein